MFKNNKFEVMYFNKRISYGNSFDNNLTTKSPPFSSAYFCQNILPEQIVFEEVNKTKFMGLDFDK